MQRSAVVRCDDFLSIWQPNMWNYKICQLEPIRPFYSSSNCRSVPVCQTNGDLQTTLKRPWLRLSWAEWVLYTNRPSPKNIEHTGVWVSPKYLKFGTFLRRLPRHAVGRLCHPTNVGGSGLFGTVVWTHTCKQRGTGETSRILYVLFGTVVWTVMLPAPETRQCRGLCEVK